MDLQTKERELYKYIELSFNEYDWYRAITYESEDIVPLSDDNGEPNYYRFLENQEKFLQQCSNEFLEKLWTLYTFTEHYQKRGKKEFLYMIDMERPDIIWDYDGFYLAAPNKVVLYHPR